MADGKDSSPGLKVEGPLYSPLAASSSLLRFISRLETAFMVIAAAPSSATGTFKKLFSLDGWNCLVAFVPLVARW